MCIGALNILVLIMYKAPIFSNTIPYRYEDLEKISIQVKAKEDLQLKLLLKQANNKNELKSIIDS